MGAWEDGAIAGTTERDGSAVHIRPIRADDAPGLLALCERLSPRSRYLRFFSTRPLSLRDAQAFASVDHDRHEALVATAGASPDAPIVGVARYAPSEHGTAEIGLVVADAWQGRGLGGVLLERLLAEGARHGVEVFSAEVLAENGRALRLLNDHTGITQRRFADGVVSLVFRPVPPAVVSAA